MIDKFGRKVDYLRISVTENCNLKCIYCIDDNILNTYKNDILTIPANLTGVPSLSIPCGLTEDNLPIGLQLIGNHFEEKKIYNVAYQFEKTYNLHDELKKLTMGAE